MNNQTSISPSLVENNAMQIIATTTTEQSPLKKRCLSEQETEDLQDSSEMPSSVLETQLVLIPPTRPTLESVFALVQDLAEKAREQQQEIQDLHEQLQNLESLLEEKTAKQAEMAMHLDFLSEKLAEASSNSRSGHPLQHGQDSSRPMDQQQQSMPPLSSNCPTPPLNQPTKIRQQSNVTKSHGTTPSLNGRLPVEELPCLPRASYASAVRSAPHPSVEEMDVAVPSNSSQDDGFQPARNSKKSRHRTSPGDKTLQPTTPIVHPPHTRPPSSRFSKVQSMLSTAAATTPDPMEKISCLFQQDAATGVPPDLDGVVPLLREEIAVIRVSAPNLNAASKREPKLAWRAILRAFCTKANSSTPWRILDILPVSPTVAEVFLPLSQREPLCHLLQNLIVPATTYQLGERDLKRRTAAYRGGYFKELRRAALSDLSPTLQIRLLKELLADPLLQSPSRHRSVALAATHDLEELHPTATVGGNQTLD